MATKATKSTAVAKRASPTDLAALDKALSAESSSIRDQVSAGGGAPRLSINTRSGMWQTGDGSEIGEVIRVAVIDFVSENRWYPHPYSPGAPLPPNCYAIGKNIKTMGPPDGAPEPQSDACFTCPKNEWKSDPKGGNGKACKNMRALAVILEEDFEDPDATIYVIQVPPTSIKSFDGFALQCDRQLNGPPIKATVDITSVPVGNYYSMSFANAAPNDLYPEHFALREEALDLLMIEPDTSSYVPSTQKPNAQKANPRAAAPARARSK